MRRAVNVWVADNAALHHLAFDALMQTTSMGVVRNHVLPACEVDAMFARIPGPHGLHSATGH